MSFDTTMATIAPNPRNKPAERSSEDKLMMLHDVRNMWTGPINTQVYDDKLADMSNQTRNHLYWLARNKQICAKSRPQTGRAPSSSDRPLSQCSWTNLSVMFTSASGGTAASRHADDISSVTSSSSKVRSFCYLCSTLEEHQRCHLNLRPRAPSSQGESAREKRQRVRYIPPVPRTRKRVEEEPALVVQEALYKVTVWTGDVPGASTDANVYISMEGDQGALVKTRLWRRQGTSNFSFVRGSREMFHIKGPKLGNLRTITVEHDGVEKRHGWYVERVEVQCMLTKRVWEFPCKSWLSLHHGDSTIRQDLQAAVKEQVVREFEVLVETGNKRFAGTDANVYVMLHGTEGSTGRQQLNAQHPQGTCFQRGQTDRFKIQVPDVGELRSLRIEHDGQGTESSWYLTKVTVRDVYQPQCVYHFVYNGWLARDVGGDGRLWRELRAYKHMPTNGTSGKPVQYEVVVKTGDIYGAGTSANVYICLHGTTGKTRNTFLSDSTTNFERSKTESFKLKALDVGKLTSIKIGVDTSGPDSGWFCDHIKVRKALSRHEISEQLTQQKQAWRAARKQQKEADKASQPEKEQATDSTGGENKGEEDTENVPTTPTTKSGSETPGRSQIPQGRRSSAGEVKRDRENAGVFDDKGRVLRVPVCEEWFFPCAKWLASEQGDCLFERELQVARQKLCYQER